MMNHWLFRCKDITELISLSYDEDLSFWKRLGIRFHLKMCHLCRRYEMQLDLIHGALSRISSDLEGNPPPRRMPDGAKTRLKELIR